ncbi:MAG: hypothetical protein HZB38_01650 [Planctomycetes bacterium]|nr:hypothetical protein [Planctomycetota bacterium]
MEKNEFLVQQFATLRHEIEGHQSRSFWIVVIGLLGIPTASYFLLEASIPLWMALPFFLLVLMVLFLAQQNFMMRAGRYIREYIEPKMECSPGWEAWIESRPAFRVMDRQFAGSLLVLFFLFYFLLIGLALNRLYDQALSNPGLGNWMIFGAAAAVYTIATLFGFATLIHHWRSSVSTMPNQKP